MDCFSDTVGAVYERELQALHSLALFRMGCVTYLRYRCRAGDVQIVNCEWVDYPVCTVGYAHRLRLAVLVDTPAG